MTTKIVVSPRAWFKVFPDGNGGVIEEWFRMINGTTYLFQAHPLQIFVWKYEGKRIVDSRAFERGQSSEAS